MNSLALFCRSPQPPLSLSAASHALRRVRPLFSTTVRSFSSDPTATADAPKTALILGSSGCLGSALVSHLSSRSSKSTSQRGGDITVIGADCVEPSSEQLDNHLLDAFIPLPHPSTNPTLAKTTRELCLGLKELDDLSGSPGRWYDGPSGPESGLTLDAVICASGGWEGDPPTASGKVDDPTDSWMEKLIEADADAHGDGVERMLRMNLYPVLAAGRAMDLYMGEQGLFVAIGAAAALAPCPAMYAYGLSKSAVHHYIQTLGASSGPKTGLGHKSQRKKATVELRRSKAYLDDMTALAILPSMIDTPNNRKFADKDADFDNWTKPEDIAKEIGEWLEKPYLRPNSGALIKVFPDSKRGEGAVFKLAR